MGCSTPPILACLGMFLLSAQTPAPKPPAASGEGTTPVLKVTTHLVQINVVVHGRKNEPVDDLKREDFTVFDNKQRQQIATFSMESALFAGEKAQTVAPLPQNTFTNRVELRPKAPNSVTVMLLDGLNTRFEDQVYAKQQLIKFLAQLQPGDRVAVYALGRELRTLHDFTTDSSSILRVLSKYKDRINIEVADSNPEEPNSGDEELDQWMREADQKIADYQTVNRVQTTLAAVQAIANHVSRIPGRKNLIWISGGFPMQMGLDEFNVSDTQEKRTFSDEMEQAARALNAASLAVYPVDARGLMGDPGFSSTSRGSANPRKGPQAGPQTKGMRAIQNSHDTMEALAQRTGGKAYYNSNDLKGAIRGAIEDSRVTYVLGFYPAHGVWDGKFHELKVQVDRKGTNVRHRLGYFAFADQPLTEKEKKAAFKEALWSPLESTTLGLTLRVGPNLPKAGKMRVVLLVDVRNVQLQKKEDRWTGKLEVLFVQQGSPEKPPVITGDAMEVNLKQETYAAAMQRGLLMMRDLDLADAGYQLKVAVRDANTGNTGTVIARTQGLKEIPVRSPAAPK
ncbi:MAG TPA: VWA domain-containing protein [Bryobacteraceae bacterium]|nr:VWA domain-containing protein [Bryobacteraceae bacterium]